MPISDELLKATMELEGVTEDEMSKWLDKTLSDLAKAGDDRNIRSIRERQLKNPMGSSTPLDQQISRSEQNLYRLEEKAAPLVKKLAPQLLVIELQKQRVAKLKEAEANARAARVSAATELHSDYRSFCDQLMRLGATPTKLGDLRQHEQAILADLIRWKVADPRFEDDDNPWRELNASYAARLLERAEAGKRPPPLSTRDKPRAGDHDHSSKRNSELKLAGLADDGIEVGELVEHTGVSHISREMIEVDNIAEQNEVGNIASTQSYTNKNTVCPDAPRKYSLDEKSASAIAESMLDKQLFLIAAYWPARLIEPFDYNQERLVSALEAQALDETQRWDGGLEFLQAAREGQAESFIKARRELIISYFTRSLLAGDEEILERARSLQIIS